MTAVAVAVVAVAMVLVVALLRTSAILILFSSAFGFGVGTMLFDRGNPSAPVANCGLSWVNGSRRLVCATRPN